jgi:hypothetical protein
LEAGEQEQVFILRQTADPYAIHVPEIKTYIDYMHQVSVETSILPFFAVTSYAGSIRSSVICYYDEDGQITETEVHDVGALLQEIHRLEEGEYWTRSRPPLDIIGSMPVDLRSTRPLSVCISLWSDIWLPQVVGCMEDEPANSVAELYDNRELAACHTPRLNSFLARAKAITLDFDGEWKGGFPYHPFYRHMEDGDTGIRLDI